MSQTPSQLRADAERIWWAGVEAVQPANLIRSAVQVEGTSLLIGDEELELSQVRRLAIVGAGKAAAAMAVALEQVLGEKLLNEKNAIGWVNVPADCLLPTRKIHLHAARPAGVNEPRPAGVVGTERILEIVANLGPDDLCLCLLSGGGSALLPAPAAGLSLDDEIRVARLLGAAGANIAQLNTVRAQLSRVKCGGLARACRAATLISLIISDVPGDPLDLIASGPTVDSTATPRDALRVLTDLNLADHPDLENVANYLRAQSPLVRSATTPTTRVLNLVIANNATAVDAAGCEAERLGYSHAMIAATQPEGAAEEVGRHLAAMALNMRSQRGPDCLIAGGEPTVKLVDSRHRGLGGRNQQLALAALQELGDCTDIALLSAGTDGEDGPTDAAGAVVTADIVAAASALHLDTSDFLRRNDAYHYFRQSGGLLKTGPTQTNVCDLRVIVTAQSHHD